MLGTLNAEYLFFILIVRNCLRQDGVVNGRCIEIQQKLLKLLAGQKLFSVSSSCDKRNTALFLDFSKKGQGRFAKAQDTGIGETGKTVFFYGLFANIKKNMEQTSADACLCHLLCF